MNKLILDVPIASWAKGMNAALSVMRDYPQQKSGTSNGIPVLISAERFVVIRNKDSYTVKGMNSE